MPRLHEVWTVCCELVGRRRNVCAKGNANRGASRLCPVPNIVQYAHKKFPQTPGVHLALLAGCNIILTLTLKSVSLQQVCRQTDKSKSEAVVRQLPVVEVWEAEEPILLKLIV